MAVEVRRARVDQGAVLHRSALERDQARGGLREPPKVEDTAGDSDRAGCREAVAGPQNQLAVQHGRAARVALGGIERERALAELDKRDAAGNCRRPLGGLVLRDIEAQAAAGGEQRVGQQVGDLRGRPIGGEDAQGGPTGHGNRAALTLALSRRERGVPAGQRAGSLGQQRARADGRAAGVGVRAAVVAIAGKEQRR